MKTVVLLLVLLPFGTATVLPQAQVPPGAGDSKAATGGARPGQMNEGFIGRDVPHFDPGNDVMSYDGKLWNINDNRLFRARFEKYLNAAPATDAADVSYRQTIDKIMDLLTPGKATKANQDAAFILLKEASKYKDDANLCSVLSDAIYSAKNTLAQVERLKRENELWEKQRSQAEWNNEVAATGSLIAPKAAKDDAFGQENQKLARDARVATVKRKLSEAGQTIENNKVRMASLELTAKGYLQALIMQFFATRRFQHVIIANRFYRALYTDGDNSIEVFKKMVDGLPTNKDAGQAKIEAEFDPKVSGESKGGGYVGGGTGSNGTGAGGRYAPSGQSFSAQGIKMGVQNLGVESLVGGAATAAQAVSKLINSLSQLDGLASEAIRDVNEGVEAYKFLLSKNEMKSATERLAETFALGEYMPTVRLLSRDDKRRALDFSQKGNELLAALEVNDLTRAEKLVNELQTIAVDFDVSKPLAKVETAKTVSSMHLAKARNAAASGDKAAMESELRAAAEIWPRNPALSEVGGMIFSQSDVQQRAITDFDQLLSQKNFRQIFDDKMRFIAATAMFPEKQEQLRKVLDDMALVEAAVIRAQEVEKRGDFAGAWESAESAYRQFPDDNKLNQVRANLTTRAADFVRALKQAEEQEKKDQFGSSLAWYLKAQKTYPASDFARQGIERINTRILPDAK
jgi:tetratricopeptide (TPR) repeat protein